MRPPAPPRAAAGGLMLLCLALLAPPIQAAEPAVRLAVMPFDNGAPDPLWDPLGKGFQAMLTTDLGLLSGLDLVERARLADIEAELGLASSGRVDPETAAAIGKLAGATHLVAGSFAVTGGLMRIDARVFAVQTGAIITTTQTQGEAEAFFELEKVLVKKLAAAVGRELAPKDRARIAGIHTADLDAFVEFGRGVALVDHKDYDQARLALEKAARIDPTFELASLTLADLDALIRDARQHADAAATAQQEAERLRQAAADQVASEALQRIWALARDAADPTDRLLASALLYSIYSHPENHPAWGALSGVDPLQLELTAGQLAARYLAEMPAVHPRLPLVPSAVYQPGFPRRIEDFDAFWAELRARNDRVHSLGLNELFQVHYLADPMLLDPAQKAALFEQLLATAEAHPECLSRDRPDGFVRGHLDAAKQWSRALELDRAAAHYLAVRETSSDPDTLQKVAEGLEDNREQLAVLEAHRGDALAAELIRVDGARDAERLLERGDRAAVVSRLQTFRDWDQRTGADFAWRWLGDVATFELSSTETVVLRSGAQRNRRRASGLRYLAWPRHYERRPSPSLVLAMGTRAHGDLRAGFRLGFERPDDFEHSRAEAVDEATRPTVAFLFGTRDIGTTERPTEGWAARISPDGSVDVGRLIDEPISHSWAHGPPSYPHRLRLERVDGGSVGKLGPSQRVRIDVRGPKVTVTVGTKTVRVTLPEAPEGFAGLWIADEGFVAIDEPTLEAK